MKYVSTFESVKGTSYEKNEDHYYLNEDLGLHIVCDGRGEVGRGAVASHMTTDFISQVMIANKKIFNDYKVKPSPELKNSITELIERSVTKISTQIQNTIKQDPARRHMGTTLSLVLVLNNSVFLAHVGNSRIYLERSGKIHVLTDDHISPKKKKPLVDSNLSLETANETDNEQNNLTRILGSSHDLKVDLLFFEIMSHDNIVLVTDGVSDVINNDKFLEIIQKSDQLNLAKELVKHSIEKKTTENATVVAISFEKTIKKVEAITPKDKYTALEKIPLFSQLDYKELSKLINLMTSKTILKGENIVIEGESGHELFVILNGNANVFIKNNKVASLKDGDYFGELSLLDSEPRSATVKAVDNLEILILAQKDFYFILTNEAHISVKILWNFSQTLAARLRGTGKETTDPEKDKLISLTNNSSNGTASIKLNFDTE